MIRTVNEDTLILTDEAGEEILRLKETLSNDVFELTATGRIFGEAMLELEDELMAAIMSGCSILLDFTNVVSISSEVLNVILTAQQQVEKNDRLRFTLKSPRKKVLELLHNTGFDQLINIE